MKIFAILIAKNEADIIGSVIESAKEWADKIFAVDNDSTDGTWEIIQSMKDDILVPVRQEKRSFNRDFRGEIFNQFRNLSTEDDWWCFALDADEFYPENPKEFLKRIPRKYHVVAKKSLDFVLTKEDLAEHDFSGSFEQNKEHIKYIKTPCWSEPRFFRYRKSLEWEYGKNWQFPPKIGVLSPELIPVMHYQYRSPKQMQARLDMRNSLANKIQGGSFKHIKETDWHELLEERKNCVLMPASDEIKLLPAKGNIRQSFLKKLYLRLGIALRIF